MALDQDAGERDALMLPSGEYRPEFLSRRGEWIAWGSAALVILAWIVLVLRNVQVVLAMPIVAVILVLAAASISLGNWMDRGTVLRIHDNGVEFENGLRHVNMGWEAIREIRIVPARWGNKVQVIGAGSYFEFRTLGEISVQGESKGRIGFPQGEALLEKIVHESGLEKIDRPDNGYYYGRR